MTDREPRGGLPDARTLAELVRAPAALTVPGDVLAGAAASGWPYGGRSAGLVASSVCLYWAGMALNDYADREIDKEERPGRPIPSGRVTPGFALGTAAGLTAAGVAAAGLAGGRSALKVAIPLAGAVWAYDMALKNTPAGPVAMAAARTLNVLLGAGGRRAALPQALTVGAHTLSLTVLSRGEVHGTRKEVPLAGLAGTAAIAGVAALAGRRGVPAPARAAAAALATIYGAAVGGPQSSAVQQPTPGRVRKAVGAGILGLIPLQAALVARNGSMAAAAGVLAAFPLARRLSRKVSPT
ncbi:SCO3242 family prenyltransferase [Sphaerisporangium sp. NPDC051011]|uniref:SCO3242 family prenyltransferase n=1 Tax=Sphaerisporangium sp. NPDC051011 TaxID=3155792 RepID=UPI0033FDA233